MLLITNKYKPKQIFKKRREKDTKEMPVSMLRFIMHLGSDVVYVFSSTKQDFQRLLIPTRLATVLQLGPSGDSFTRQPVFFGKVSANV